MDLHIIHQGIVKKVCYRGLLTTLLCSPYEGKEGWEVTAAKWRGTLYLRQQVCQFGWSWSHSDLAAVFCFRRQKRGEDRESVRLNGRRQ